MRSIITKYLIVLFIILTSIVIYLSLFGFETNRFNNQISYLIKNINKDLDIELKKIKLKLDPLNFEIDVNTIGSKLKIRENKIDIQNIKTTISIRSFLNKKFSFSNLYISTNSLEIKNLISFLRKINNTPEFYLLEKITKNGYLISNIYLEFDEQGKVKDNFKFEGFVKDGRVSILKKHDIEKIDLIFKVSKNDYQFKDIDLSWNKTPLKSQEIKIKKIKNDLLIEGTFENENVKIDRKSINNFFRSFLIKYQIENLNLSSKNNFLIKLNKKYQIIDFKLSSNLRLNNLYLKNNLKLDEFFPNLRKIIELRDHSINIKYDKKKFSIKGSGYISLQEKEDDIEYFVSNENNRYNFETILILANNPLKIDFLGYQKKENSNAKIKINGLFIPKKKIVINSGFLNENNNSFNVEKLIFDETLKVFDLESIKINYQDKSKNNNQLELVKKKDQFYLSGSEFNADYLVEDLINEDKNDLNFINKNFDLNINIKKIHLDKNFKLQNFKGNLNFKNNKVIKADLDAFFSDKEKLIFTINSKNNEKVTTLFLDKAEPLVKRYKFIKGFKNGSLDFYSVTKADKSISSLKIYDFNLKELPILTKILTLASLQGIADILSGEGISFEEFEMKFQNEKKGIQIDEIYAIGPAISILMDGYYIKDDLISLKGTLVPATTINKFVGSIPVLGKILVGTKTGEGVFGVSFKIKGPPKNLKTSVNPIKTLTPRFITRTLEKIKKN